MNFESNFSLKSSLNPIQDKIRYRREKVLRLRTKGHTNVEISHKLQYSLSSIEKDIKVLRTRFVNDCKEDVIIE